MRARSFKPAFFLNEALAELAFAARLLFVGLWCMADREGRLEYRPKRMKATLFPYDDVEIAPLIEGLESQGFIHIYAVNGAQYIQVINFTKHQNPHKNEKASEIPPPEDIATLREDSGAKTEPLGLTPDSCLLTPDVLTPDSIECADAPVDVQSLVSLYVDHHTVLGRTKPNSRQIGQAAKAIKEHLDLGAKPEALGEAIRRLVADAKTPSMLGLKLGDVEKERSRKATTYPAGRSKHGEF